MLHLALATAAIVSPQASTTRPSMEEIIGADISWVQEQEENGVRFSEGGVEKDILAILQAHGFNWIRLRIFHDPQAPGGYSAKGYCDLPHTLAMAKRVRAAGMKFLLDFHYSDTWADPGKQFKPAAWKDKSGKELEAAVRDYTRDVLTALTRQNTPPDMVQIGNEITGGMLWPDGKMWETGKQETLCDLLKAGIAGAKAAQPNVAILIHTATGGRNKEARGFFDCLAKYKVPFDVIGVSYYPEWEGPTDKLRENLADLAGRYPQRLVVAEYTAPDGKAVYDIVRALPKNKGWGAFLWEPTRWPQGNAALFEVSGKTKPAIDAYPFR